MDETVIVVGAAPSGEEPVEVVAEEAEAVETVAEETTEQVEEVADAAVEIAEIEAERDVTLAAINAESQETQAEILRDERIGELERERDEWMNRAIAAEERSTVAEATLLTLQPSVETEVMEEVSPPPESGEAMPEHHEGQGAPEEKRKSRPGPRWI